VTEKIVLVVNLGGKFYFNNDLCYKILFNFKAQFFINVIFVLYLQTKQQIQWTVKMSGIIYLVFVIKWMLKLMG